MRISGRRASFAIALVVSAATLPAVPALAAQWGALAYNSANGAYGFSYNYASKYDADRRALNECGYGCQVVLRFGNGCAAYATGYDGSYGWGHYPTRYAAEQRALAECSARGGGCAIRVWACNGG
jgi:hypothetical protein